MRALLKEDLDRLGNITLLQVLQHSLLTGVKNLAQQNISIFGSDAKQLNQSLRLK